MLRFLFALLAVLSGLVATGQPVAARACAEQAQAMQRVDCIVPAENASARIASLRPADEPQDLRAGDTPAYPGALLAPTRTVRIRCDRALE